MSEMSDLMIEVVGLKKDYPGRTAVGEVSFSVPRGGIVGLLGPNGAGKSTILKVLSCYMPATGGTVRVGGFDVFRESHEVRKRIGYMPENNPLHLDMRVRDYLRFRSRLKGLNSKRTRDRVAAVMDLCGLIHVSSRIIGQLSKGYRQRIGVADALVSEPELVILDEPMIGLDPSQIRAVRELLMSLGQNYTVLLSSHVLSEVEMICSHVVILRDGKVLAADTKDNLLGRMGDEEKVIAEIKAPPEALRECGDEMESIEHIDLSPLNSGYYRCVLTGRKGVDLRAVLFNKVRSKGWKLRELTRSRPTLEDVYLQVTRGDEEGSV